MSEDVGGTAVLATEDPVLASLHQAEEQYQEMRNQWDNQATELHEARTRLARLEEARLQTTAELQKAQRQLGLERQRADRNRERARQMADAVKALHRALFEGNVFSLILKSCLTITGATRGLYLTVQGTDQPRVRAAVDVDGYPQAPVSDYLRALCAKVVEEDTSFMWNAPAEMPEGPRPDRPAEKFHSAIVAPVVLLKNLNGVVLLADKATGSFEQEDVDTVLSVGSQAAVAVENRHLQCRVQEAYFAVVGVLADAVEAKDPYLQGHCEMVAHYARLTAQQLALDDRQRGIVCYGGLLHDIGKIGVSDGVLNKPGQLLPEEWQLMRSHVRVGRDLLARVPVLEAVADVVLHHHERYDGKGYPDGLAGEEISMGARIVCVVDAYCAMISRRSYKDAYDEERARGELLRGRAAQFDPRVVDAFLQVLDQMRAHKDGTDPADCDVPPLPADPADFVHVLRPHAFGRQGRDPTSGTA